MYEYTHVCQHYCKGDNFNSFLTSRLVHPHYLDESIPSFRVLWCTFITFIVFSIKVLEANSADPDQMPHSGHTTWHSW